MPFYKVTLYVHPSGPSGEGQRDYPNYSELVAILEDFTPEPIDISIEGSSNREDDFKGVGWIAFKVFANNEIVLDLKVRPILEAFNARLGPNKLIVPSWLSSGF
jgi:hypothetical protein